MIQHDPLQIIRDMGYRVVWMEDFDYRVFLVDGADVVLIDRLVPRQDAADCLLELVAPLWPERARREAS